MTDKVSIIVVAWDTNRIQRQITSTCLGNISKFTDKEDYELIFIDQQCDKNLDERHNVINIDKHIILKENIGCSAAMNRGYKESSPECKYICFMHNDVFVPNNWLPTLMELVKRDDCIVMPTQGRLSREYVKEEEEDLKAWDDAGLIIMSKDNFIKSGGWDERFKTIYQDAIFRYRLPKKYVATNKVIITHIGAVGYYHDEQFENEAYDREGEIYNKTRDELINKIPQKNYL
jgi:glycosyltransferase involved in cell wall biosynthesis